MSTADHRRSSVLSKSETVTTSEVEPYAALGTLTQSWPGIFYQLNHLTFILHCASRRKDPVFYLSTEMIAAGKLDDLVLQYKDDEGVQVGRFVQIKHRNDQSQVIFAKQLLLEENGAFSVPKYFTSWQEVKKNELFSQIKRRHMILCTDIGLDLEDLRKNEINYEEAGEPDKSFELKSRVKKTTAWYKLTADENSNRKLYNELRATSHVRRLANKLASCVHHVKDMRLETVEFLDYHLALVRYVFDPDNTSENNKMKKSEPKFRGEFIRNECSSPKVRKFRQIFLSEFERIAKPTEINPSEADLWKEITDKFRKQRFRQDFGDPPAVVPDPQLTNLDELAVRFVGLLKKATDHVVRIIKTKSKKENAEEPIKVIIDNIDKMTGHVLIKHEKKIVFSPRFLKDSKRLRGNIGEFRTAFKNQMGRKRDLELFEFQIEKYKPCTDREFLARDELPDDDVDAEEISEFLGEFTLAVNQPDPDELGDMIKSEMIGNGPSNHLQPDQMVSALKIKIFEWFSGRGREGNKMKYLSHKECREFFDIIHHEVSSTITSGVNLVHCEKMRAYDAYFISDVEMVKEFLDMDESSSPLERMMQLVTNSENTTLYALRVYHTLQKIRKYTEEGSFVFIPLETLIIPKIMNRVKKTFGLRKHPDLLLIDFGKSSVEQYLFMLCNLFGEIMENNVVKKIIFITRKCDSSAVSAIGHQIYCEKEGGSGFGHLTDVSKKKLLEKSLIRFQGQEEKISFSRLLGVHNCDNISADAYQALENVIDSTTLVKLIRNDEIQISDALEGLGTIENYYINRRIFQRVVIKKDILKDKETHDLFAFSREAFENLSENNSELNVHWLKEESGKYVWQTSRGKIAHLLPYRDQSASDGCHATTYTHLTEEELIARKGPLIISNVAGMGKSTLLTHLAQRMKYIESNLLVIRINLTYHTKELNEEQKKPTFNSNKANEAVDFVVDKLSSSNTTSNLERELFKIIIKSSGKAALLFDGFDEIHPTYGGTVINLLEAVVKLPLKHLVVTTRSHTSEALEKSLGTFSHKLQPFSPDDQLEFLKKFWKRGLSGGHATDDVLENRLGIRAEKVMHLLAQSIDHQITKFTGVLLQTMMVAEIYQYGGAAKREPPDATTEMLHSEDDEPKLPRSIDLIDLYRCFVDKKYHIYCAEKKRGDDTNVGVITDSRNAHQIFLRTHEKLACDALFDENTVRLLLNSQTDVVEWYESFRDGNEQRTGIVTEVINGKPQFIHQTFAEYFTATFIMRKLKDHRRVNEVLEFFVEELFVRSQYKTIRAFLNCLLLREAYTVGNISWIFDLCQTKSWIRDSRYRNADHGTLYHVAAKECHVGIVQFFINRLSSHSGNDSEEQFDIINLRDRYGRTSVAIAIENTCDLDLVKCLVEGGANVHWQNEHETLLHSAVQKPNNLPVVMYLIEKGAYVNIQTHNGDTPLHRAAIVAGNLEIVKYLILVGAYVNMQTQDDATPLHHAVIETGNLDVVEHLCNAGAVIDCLDIDGTTPLHNAAGNAGNLDVVKYLIEKGAHVNISAHNGATPLHHAAIAAGNSEIVEYLINSDADVSCKTLNGDTPLHIAVAQSGNLDTLKYLIGNGADCNIVNINGNTPLHIAISESGDWDAIKYLILNCADVNIGTRSGDSLLHIAIAKSLNLSEVKYLCDNGADVNHQNPRGMTPLHVAAAQSASLDAVKYLIDTGADVNMQSHNGDTPLHRASIVAGNSQIVKYLIDNGADVNTQNQDGVSPLNQAVTESDNFKTVNYLCNAGAAIDCQDVDGTTPLYNAARNTDNLDLVKHLIEKGANVNILAHNGATPLHHASIETGNSKMVKYLIEKDSDVNHSTYNGDTPLHIAAAQSGNTDTVKYLVENGADCNVVNHDGDTPLHIAVAKLGNLDVIRCLIEKGADVNVSTSKGDAPLHIAVAKSGGLKEVGRKAYLCDNGADVISQNPYGITPLYTAGADPGDLEVVKYLISKGADVNTQTHNGDTLLHRAVVVAGNLEIVKYLIDNGADVNIRTQDDATPLHHAVIEIGNFHIVNYSCKSNAFIDCQDIDGATPLYNASGITANLNVVRCLIKRGANVNIGTRNGDTPLHIVPVHFRNIETIKYLCDNGADVKRQNEAGRTPVHNIVASHYVILDAIKYLIDNRANVNIQTHEGDTPLHIVAANSADLDLVRYLIEKRADVNCQNKYGRTPLHNIAAIEPSRLDIIDHLSAVSTDNKYQKMYPRKLWPFGYAQNDNIDVVKLLLDRGADPDLEDNDGQTALTLALSMLNNANPFEAKPTD